MQMLRLGPMSWLSRVLSTHESCTSQVWPIEKGPLEGILAVAVFLEIGLP